MKIDLNENILEISDVMVCGEKVYIRLEDKKLYFAYGNMRYKFDVLQHQSENEFVLKDFLTKILPFVKEQYETCESYKLVIDLIVEKAKDLEFDIISGGERRDFFFSLMPAYLLGKPHLSIFKDGETFFSEDVSEKAVKVSSGDLSGKKSLHIADLITEASSYTNAWIPSLRGVGATITDTIAVIDRLQGGEANLAKEGVNMYTFTKIEPSLFDEAEKKGIITAAQKAMVAEFIANPIDYMKAFLTAHPDFIDAQIDLGGKPKQRAEMAISRGYVPGRS